MRTRLISATIFAAVIGVTSLAGAHGDPNADGTTRCDVWTRTGHTHDHADNSDIKVGDPQNTIIHSHSGHHVVRNSLGYVEVVGGQAYRGPNPQGQHYPGQGGFVQGELDVASGVPDVDWNIVFFGPDADNAPALDPNSVLAWAQAGYGKVCISVNNTKTDNEVPI